MPNPPPKACYTCGRINCDAHKRKAWQSRGRHGVRRIRGSKLQAIRRDKLTREPWCRECQKEGVFTLATVVDHIVSLGEGGTEADDNRQPLCKPHSDAKTRAESRRGVDRSRS